MDRGVKVEEEREFISSKLSEQAFTCTLHGSDTGLPIYRTKFKLLISKD